MSGPKRFVQVFVELRAEDPEAVSAGEVARHRLEAARGLTRLRRLRMFELGGALPASDQIEVLLHRSILFYNPSKETCRVRDLESGAAPMAADEQLALVFERGRERRAAAERWWKRETGERAEIREGVVWAVTFAVRDGAADRMADLTVARSRAHGLFCNPHAQEWRAGDGTHVPLPWFTARAARRRKGAA